MLYVIGTPIGNIRDITLRTLDTLKVLDVIICESHTLTLKLLRHYEIAIPRLVNIRNLAEVEEVLTNAESKVGLMVDAGTPSISDPGYKVLEAAFIKGVKIECIPGVSSVISALSVCPVKFDDFLFVGFLPKKSGRLERFLNENLERNIVLFESPYRIKKTLEILSKVIPERRVFIAREITKKFESYYFDLPSKLAAVVPAKGEFTLLIPK